MERRGGGGEKLSVGVTARGGRVGRIAPQVGDTKSICQVGGEEWPCFFPTRGIGATVLGGIDAGHMALLKSLPACR